ncbi:MAG TPA: hypothetical protein VKQ52_13130 [Puia sp.]|nr:hypothetical protein [Puia sp.]
MKSLFIMRFGKLLLGASFLLILATAHGQSLVSSSGSGDSAVTVRYLGVQDDLLVFNVAYSNPDGSRFQLTVKDQDGAQLYQSIFNDKAFFKQFRLPKSDKDRMVFIFHDYKDADIVKAFDVNVNSRFVREVAVRKVD